VKAAAAGPAPVLHRLLMQALAIPRGCRTIYIPVVPDSRGPHGRIIPAERVQELRVRFEIVANGASRTH
jgi:hypothetical protein